MTYQYLYTQLSGLPKDLMKEVADFIEFLKQKRSKAVKGKKRKSGLAKGQIKLADNFDAALDDFKTYM